MNTLKIGDMPDDVQHLYCFRSLPHHDGRFTEFIAYKDQCYN